MLREAWWWCTTPCARWARGVGILAESCAIGARSRRCATAWHDHLQRCRERILAAVPPGGSVAILGAGWLNDVPLAALAERCSRVVLVDAVFPRRVRRALSRSPTVSLHEADLSGVARELWHQRRVTALTMPTWQELGAPDLLVSCMTVSQLPLIPLGWAVQRDILDEGAAEAWARRIRSGHLDLLASAPTSLLLTDTVVTSWEGAVDLLPGLNLPPPLATWSWEVAPAGEAHPDHPLRHRVVACRITAGPPG